MPAQGQWNLFGINLPDFGITERLGVGTANPNYIPQQQPSTSNLPVYDIPSSGILGASTGSQQIIPGSQGLGTTGNAIGPYGPQLPTSTGQSGAGPTANNPGGGNPDWNRLNQEDIQRSIDAANVTAQAENQRLNTQFDYSKAQLEGQLGPLGTQKEQALGQVELGLGDVRRQVGTSKTNLATNTQQQINQAGSTARNVQGQNRNVLRALGILNSSAAGQILAKPLNQFDEQRAQLGQFLVQKTTELDDFVNQKVAEATQVKNSIVQNYNDLVNKIQTDLRFNDRQRNDALQAANAALSQRMAEISQAVMNYQNQAQLQKQQFAASLAGAMNYQNPQYNQQAFQALGLVNPTQTRQTAAIYEDPNKRKTLTGV